MTRLMMTQYRKAMLAMAAAVMLLSNSGGSGSGKDRANDPDNPTCPLAPSWAADQVMKLTVGIVKGNAIMDGDTPIYRFAAAASGEEEKKTGLEGFKILLAEGVVDVDLPARLEKVIKKNSDIDEIWLRSPGGDARAGNAAGLMIRKELGLRKDGTFIVTRIPSGWTCFSACNFVFMGGDSRIVEEGGHFMVHMFTLTGDRDAIDYSVALGTDSTIALIGDIEQESALLATEDNDFLIRMGVSRRLLSEVMYRQKAVKTQDDKTTRYCLSVDEAREYNVANGVAE